MRKSASNVGLLELRIYSEPAKQKSILRHFRGHF